jgi:Zn-dependent peptidase ImmA (M78 family)
MENDSARIGFARKKARQIIKDAKVISPPVILRKIIDFLGKEFDIDIIKADFKGEYDGITVTIGDSHTVGFDENNPINRKRFSIAHELGHVVLGHTNSKNSDYDYESKGCRELEANEFAAELLAPFEFLKKDVAKGIPVKELTSKYYVSEQMLWNRIKECRLI